MEDYSIFRTFIRIRFHYFSLFFTLYRHGRAKPFRSLRQPQSHDTNGVQYLTNRNRSFSRRPNRQHGHGAQQARRQRRVVFRPVLPGGERLLAAWTRLPLTNERRPAVEVTRHQRLPRLKRAVLRLEIVADEAVRPQVRHASAARRRATRVRDAHLRKRRVRNEVVSKTRRNRDEHLMRILSPVDVEIASRAVPSHVGDEHSLLQEELAALLVA